MNYQTMQSHAREKHQLLREDARRHRLARQARTGQDEPNRSNVTGKLAAAFVGLAAVAVAIIALIQ